MGRQEVLDYLSKNKTWQFSKDMAKELNITRVAINRVLTKLFNEGIIIRARYSEHANKFVYRLGE